MRNNKALLFVVLPVALNLVLMAMYYSGSQFLQYLVAPQFDWLHHRSWREFGLLEQMQNGLLLTIVLLFAVEVSKRSCLPEKIFFLLGSLIMLFLLMEEVDYGVHFYEYYIGQESTMDVTHRNWHNRDIAGRSINGRLKKASNLLIIAWFIIFPLLATRLDFKRLSTIIPSRWFVVAFLLVVLFSSLAHYLDDAGMDQIDGVAGALKGNISEFRETNTYYLYLLYAVQLLNTSPLFTRKPLQTLA